MQGCRGSRYLPTGSIGSEISSIDSPLRMAPWEVRADSTVDAQPHHHCSGRQEAEGPQVRARQGGGATVRGYLGIFKKQMLTGLGVKKRNERKYL